LLIAVKPIPNKVSILSPDDIGSFGDIDEFPGSPGGHSDNLLVGTDEVLMKNDSF